jgi:DNA-directed RNA polymerase II subunit RPB11
MNDYEKTGNLELSIEDKNKIKLKMDSNFSNFGLFRINKEDHTIGHIIHHKLLETKDVIFCAYKKPHPLERFVIIKILTNGKLSPLQALDSSLKDLYIELTLMEEELNKKVRILS